jgi:predicted RecB family endonuclease
VKTSEEAVKRACLDYLRLKGYAAVRINNGAVKMPSGRFVRFTDVDGVADILMAANGEAWAVETKSDTGRLSEAQRAFREYWIRGGGRYVVARGIEDLKEAGL